MKEQDLRVLRIAAFCSESLLMSRIAAYTQKRDGKLLEDMLAQLMVHKDQ